MKLSEKIWRLRESQNMSQEELAEQLEVSRQTISNWENDKAVLDAEKLAKLCSIFGVSADDMLNGEDIPQPLTQSQKTSTTEKRKWNKIVVAMILAITAFALIVIATIGLIVSENKVSISSIITFQSDFIWIALIVLGTATLIGAVVAFVKKK